MAPFLYFIDREQSTTLEDVGMYNGDSLSITGVGKPEHVTGMDVTDGTLPMLGVRPVLGRLFTRRDDTAGAPKTDHSVLQLLAEEIRRQQFRRRADTQC